MKKTSLTRSMFPLALACALGSGSSPARAVDSDPQEAAITKTAEAFVEAFQKGNAKAVASFCGRLQPHRAGPFFIATTSRRYLLRSQEDR